jgi:hypothetical protein
MPSSAGDSVNRESRAKSGDSSLFRKAPFRTKEEIEILQSFLPADFPQFLKTELEDAFAQTEHRWLCVRQKKGFQKIVELLRCRRWLKSVVRARNTNAVPVQDLLGPWRNVFHEVELLDFPKESQLAANEVKVFLQGVSTVCTRCLLACLYASGASLTAAPSRARHCLTRAETVSTLPDLWKDLLISRSQAIGGMIFGTDSIGVLEKWVGQKMRPHLEDLLCRAAREWHDWKETQEKKELLKKWQIFTKSKLSKEEFELMLIAPEQATWHFYDKGKKLQKEVKRANWEDFSEASASGHDHQIPRSDQVRQGNNALARGRRDINPHKS